jgi:hypothetical protein
VGFPFCTFEKSVDKDGLTYFDGGNYFPISARANPTGIVNFPKAGAIHFSQSPPELPASSPIVYTKDASYSKSI